MPLVLADRVKETTSTSGTGTLTLDGAATGFQSFAVIGNGNTTYYTISSTGSSEWEVGIGTYTASGTTLSRDTVLASSAGAPTKTNFSSGVKDVFVTYTAARSVNVDGSTIDTFGMGATQGDILYASATDTFARLARNSTATRYLANTGVNNNPEWDQINLANGVTGTLAVANGGTGQATALIPSGTAMMFVQTAAPTGWTKSTTHDNKALRVVSGTASSGGSVAFTTAFASQAVSGSIGNTTATNQATTATNQATTATNQATTQGGSVSTSLSAGGSVSGFTLTTTEIPSHTHTLQIRSAGKSGGITASIQAVDTGNAQNPLSANSRANATGSGGSHSHGFTNPTYSSSFTGSSHNHTQDAHNHTQNSHNHTQDAHNHTFTGTAINLAVQYVDVIIATKD